MASPIEGTGGFHGGVLVHGDGQVDLAALLAALTEGAPSLTGRATLGGATADGLRLRVDDREVLAEIVVVAAGPGSASVHPWFGPMLYPVRLQGARTAPLALPPARPALIRHRFEAWAPRPDGGLGFVGCRWAEQPEMEAGVTDDEAISAKVLDRQRAFLEAHVADPAAAQIVEAWSGIGTASCDGLPIVGPLPGNPRVVALSGWGGWGLSWIGAAVSDVCDGILGRPAAAVPPTVAARRLA